jgi:PadR family transcriptional regulator PadR
MRRTHALIQVALALMQDPTGCHWGYDLSRRSGVRSGVLYPILRRMLDEGWLEDGWENPAQLSEKRPPRRYYELTNKGRRELGALLVEARSDARFGFLVGRLAG